MLTTGVVLSNKADSGNNPSEYSSSRAGMLDSVVALGSSVSMPVA